MKAIYDKPVTIKEAARIGEKAAKYNFKKAIEKYNRYESFANCECRRIGDSDYYEPISDEDVSED